MLTLAVAALPDLAVPVSRETTALLERYEAQLLSWNRKINLIGRSDEESVRRRHIEDCVQVAEMIGEAASPVVDLGSGAGLPGLVISICRPDLRIICVESDRRKAAFLRDSIRVLALNAEVLTERIEAVEPLGAPIVVARGLAPLTRLLGYVQQHLAEDGNAYLMKGRRWKEELENARAAWHFSLEAASSRTDPQAVILSIGGLHRA